MGAMSPRRGPRSARGLVLVAVLVVAVGCGRGGDGGSEEPAGGTTEALPAVTGPLAPGRTQLPGFGEVEVRIVPGPDGEPVVVCVLLAETPEQRSRGLMGVTDPDLGGYGGMLFTFPEDSHGGFWMKDTPLPLSIAYLDADGATVDVADMEPCLDRGDACPSYPPSSPYRMTLEVPRGGLDELGLAPGSAARLQVAGPCRAPG